MYEFLIKLLLQQQDNDAVNECAREHWFQNEPNNIAQVSFARVGPHLRAKVVLVASDGRLIKEEYWQIEANQLPDWRSWM